ncbi:MAG: hypothetical protein IRY85_14755 [Micromonosporaceae bacterium]|nr:hypothetical protein [Micromonosporaceae bacterium]
MRAALGTVAALIAVVGALAGCAEPDEAGEPLEITQGRACQAVEFDTVESALGIRFDTSAPATVEQTYSCVLARADTPLPDLAFTMSATTADEVIFTAILTPSLATAVPELGRIAYQITLPPGTAADGTPTGPAVEVGWLSTVPRLMLLRYTWPPNATDAEVAELAPRLIELARGIERAVTTGPTLTPASPSEAV